MRTVKTLCILGVVALSCIACEGQQFGKREGGAIGGAALGAGLGAIVGNQSGRAGEGAAIGGAFGALSGALVGNELDRQDDALRARDERLAYQQALIEENRRIIEELKRRGADVRETDRGVVVNLPDVLFGFDSAALRRDAVRAVHEIADVAASYPNRQVSVEGHTDSVGTIKYNQWLSERRAQSVTKELRREGVPGNRIRTYGFGESDPIASNRTEHGRSRNRRVEVILENY